MYRLFAYAIVLFLSTFVTVSEVEAETSSGQMVYISNSDADTVSVIDRKSRKVVRTFPVGDHPHHMLHSLDGKYLYVGNTHDDTLTVVDLHTHRPVSAPSRISTIPTTSSTTPPSAIW